MEAARMRLERGDVERGEADVVALVQRFPTTGPARRGIALVLLERDERDPTGAQALAWLDGLMPRVSAPELVSALHYERARRLERLDRFDDAAAAYASMLAVPFPSNVHWDDGGLAYARMLLAQGRARDALAVADRVLAVREGVAMLPGSYERPRFGELAMLRGRILAENLHDPRAAADAYHAVYATFRGSLLRDDALEAEAEAREAAGQRGEACSAWETLAREFPCTRRGREGTERAAACGVAVPAELARGCRRAPRDRDG
jgi:hypothetical protein